MPVGIPVVEIPEKVYALGFLCVELKFNSSFSFIFVCHFYASTSNHGVLYNPDRMISSEMNHFLTDSSHKKFLYSGMPPATNGNTAVIFGFSFLHDGSGAGMDAGDNLFRNIFRLNAAGFEFCPQGLKMFMHLFFCSC